MSPGIHSIEDLASLWDEPLDSFRPGYDHFVGVYHFLGGIDGLREIVHMEIGHFQWAVENDALSVPLDISPVEVWKHFYEVINSPGYDRLAQIMQFVSEVPMFGIGMTPEELTRIALSKYFLQYSK